MIKILIFLTLFMTSCATKHVVLESNYSVPGILDKNVKKDFELQDVTIEEASTPKKITKRSDKMKKIMKKETKNDNLNGDVVFVNEDKNYVNMNYINKNKFEKEVLNYQVYGLGLKAGKIKFTTMASKKIKNKVVMHFKLQIETSSIFDSFYSVNDVVESFVDQENFYSHRYQLVAAEDDVKKEKIELYDSDSKTGHLWKKDIKDKKETESTKDISIIPFSQDLLSAFYYIRVVDYTKGFSFNVINGEKNKKVTLIYKGKRGNNDVIEVIFDDAKLTNNINIEINPSKVIEKIEVPLKIGRIKIELM